MTADAFSLRRATADDALCLSVLATQVFLDTYATRGINTDLAREALTVYAVETMAARLRDAAVEIAVVEQAGYMVAFSDLTAGTRCPVGDIEGLEVFRLYVQAPFQRSGLGRRLMLWAEEQAARQHSRELWLTAWAGNHRALAFYRALGYEDAGRTDYVIEGQAYENRVLVKRCQHDRAGSF